MAKRIAIFASGNGSNAQNIAEYFRQRPIAQVSLILTNNPKAYVIERAKSLNIPYVIFNRQDFYHSDKVLDILQQNQIDFIALAGFLWLVPKRLIEHYPNRIVNIHPALLPNYGGKGMYGDRVFKAVLDAKEKVTGITIHYVNEQYDSGQIIFQASTYVLPDDTVETLAQRIHALEYKYYPKIIHQLVEQL